MTPLPRLFNRPKADGAATAARRLDEFGERYQQFFPRVFAYVYGRVQNVQLAEDLVADVFEKAFTKAQTLRNQEAFSTWLFTIARNVVTSSGRKRGRESIVDPDVLRDVIPSGVTVEGEALAHEEVTAVADCVKELSQREQDIISFRFDAELTNVQIAQIMNLSEANVRVIIFRALRKLRQMMLARRQG
jgi:RNA polymerase sigma-70 factor (ECF subfamily)